MKNPPVPEREQQRLATLHALRVLDTPPEERYDRITRLACRLFDVPIALVSLVDADRQWFKSKQGVEIRETPREISFCAHAIVGSGTMVIPDATRDERFSDNPVVTDDPHLRFYAGQPLHAPDGSALGTLCIIDRKPRDLEEEQLQLIRDLAGLVEDELTLVQMSELQLEMDRRRNVEAALRESEHRFRIVFDAAAIGVALLDPWRQIMEANRAFSDMLGMKKEDVEGLRLSEFTEETDAGKDAEQFAELLAGRLDHYQVNKRLQRDDGTEFEGKLTVSLVRRDLGEPHHVVVMLEELTGDSPST